MKKPVFFQSIRIQILVSFSALFIFLLGSLGYVSYHLFSRTLINEAIGYTSLVVEQERQNLDAYFDQVKTLIQLTAGESVINTALNDQETDDYRKKLSYHREIQNFLEGIIRFHPTIKDIIIVDPEGQALDFSGNAVHPDFNFYNEHWMPQHRDSQFFTIDFIGIHPQEYYIAPQKSDEKIVSVAATVLDFYNSPPFLGASVLFNIELENIREFTKGIKLEENGFFVILDSNNQTVYGSTDNQLDSNFTAMISSDIIANNGTFRTQLLSQEMLCVYTTSKVTGWKIIALIPMKDILAHNNNIRKTAIFIIFLGILSVLLISIFISLRISKPITNLMRKMQLVKTGLIETDLYDKSSIEMEKLTSRIMSMIQNINELNENLYLNQIKAKQSEIRALQYQINPHFLYNTLQSIKALAVCERTSEVSHLVSIFGDVMRYSIYQPNELVLLDKELNHLTKYIEIQQYRFPEKIRLEIYCPESCRIIKTPKLILQPLVENAIIHGFSDNRKGIISIHARVIDHFLEIKITDNGVGMNNEILEELKLKLNSGHENESDHIGLINVHERIRYRYGDQYGLTLESTLGFGTTVTLLLKGNGE